MSALNVTRRVTVTVTMDEKFAGKLSRSILRILTAVQHLDVARRDHLVNTGTIDTLLALETAIRDVLPGKQAAENDE